MRTLWEVILVTLVALLAVWAIANAQEAEPLYTELKLAEEYSAALFACHVAERSVKILSIEGKTLHGKEVMVIQADRNYDGSVDMELFFDMNHEAPASFPHYYVYDLGYKGMPNKAYRDVNGNGVCQEMEEVPVKYVVEGGQE